MPDLTPAADASVQPPSLFPAAPANDPFADDFRGFKADSVSASSTGRATAPAPVNDPFADDFKDFKPDPGSSATGSFLHHAETSVIPTLGAIPAMAVGAKVGAGVGAFGGPLAEITIPVGTVVGALAAGMGAGTAISWLQDKALSALPTWSEFFGVDERQRGLEEKQHPYASFAGELMPSIIAFRPGGWARAAMPPAASTFEKMMANPLASRLLVGGLQGGLELGQEYVHGESPDWVKGAMAFGWGVGFNVPTRIGQRLLLERPAPPAAAPPSEAPPAVGPGVGAPATPAAPTPVADLIAYKPDTDARKVAQYNALDKRLNALIADGAAEDHPDRLAIEAKLKELQPDVEKLMVSGKDFTGGILGGRDAQGRPVPDQLSPEAEGVGADIGTKPAPGHPPDLTATVEVAPPVSAEEAQRLLLRGQAGTPPATLSPEAEATGAKLPPTLAEAGDLGVMGMGDTEHTFQGTRQKSPVAEEAARSARRLEISVIGPDVKEHVVDAAARSNPDLFTQYEETQRRRDELRKWVDELRARPEEPPPAARGTVAGEAAPAAAVEPEPSPRVTELATAQQHLQATEEALNGMLGRVRVAVREAAERGGHEMERHGPPADLTAPRQPAEPAARVSPLPVQLEFIRNDVARNLMRAGIPREVAETEAVFQATQYEFRAKGNPALGTPEDIYRREHAEILRGGEGSKQPGRQRENAPRVVKEEKLSLVPFLAHRGGISASDPMIADLRAIVGDKAYPGLIRSKGGMTLDRAREAAAEAGYIVNESRGGGENRGGGTSTIRTLLDAVNDESRGRKRYRPGMEPLEGAEGREPEPGEAEAEEARRRAPEDESLMSEEDKAFLASEQELLQGDKESRFPGAIGNLSNQEFPMLDEHGNHIGHFEVDVQPNSVRILSSALNDDAIGKGYGSSNYRRVADWAQRTGRDFHSDTSVNNDVRRVYDSLRRQGYNVEENTSGKGPVFTIRASHEDREALASGELLQGGGEEHHQIFIVSERPGDIEPGEHGIAGVAADESGVRKLQESMLRRRWENEEFADEFPGHEQAAAEFGQPHAERVNVIGPPSDRVYVLTDGEGLPIAAFTDRRAALKEQDRLVREAWEQYGPEPDPLDDAYHDLIASWNREHPERPLNPDNVSITSGRDPTDPTPVGEKGRRLRVARDEKGEVPGFDEHYKKFDESLTGKVKPYPGRKAAVQYLEGNEDPAAIINLSSHKVGEALASGELFQRSPVPGSLRARAAEAEAGKKFGTMEELQDQEIKDIFPAAVSKGYGNYELPLEHNQERVGQIEFTLNTDNIKARFPWIDTEHQGRGLGVEAYRKLVDYAHSTGRDFNSDISVTAAAKHVYEALERRGYDVVKNPDVTEIHTGAISSNDGKPVFRIPAPEATELYQRQRPTEPSAIHEIPGFHIGPNFLSPDELYQIKAYHGSPHDFDKFDLSKIGTGEGNKFEGHGLNFSEDRDYADLYREPEGHLYEVSLRIDPKSFLDLDRRLGEQSQNVKEALAKIPRLAPHIEENSKAGHVVPYTAEEAEEFRKAGIAGIRYQHREGDDAPRGYVVFDDKMIDITHKDGTPVTAAERKEITDSLLQRSQKQSAKGSYAPITPEEISQGLRPLLRMRQNADASTVAHEFSHEYLQQFERDVNHPDAPQILKEDWAETLKWLGAKDASELYERTPGGDLTADATRLHEKFARGEEAFRMEGRAPSKALARVFHQFAEWMRSIYKSLQELERQAGFKIGLTDRMREVYGRRLTDELDWQEPTVIAPEREALAPHTDVWRDDARKVEPDHADASQSRLDAERDSRYTDIPHEIRAELQAKEASFLAANEPANDSGGADREGGGGPQEMDMDRGPAGPQPGGGGGGTGAGGGRVGVPGAGTEGPGVSRQPASEAGPGSQGPNAGDVRPAGDQAAGTASPAGGESAGSDAFNPRKRSNPRIENFTSVEQYAQNLAASVDRSPGSDHVQTDGELAGFREEQGFTYLDLSVEDMRAHLARTFGGVVNLGKKIAAFRQDIRDQNEKVYDLMTRVEAQDPGVSIVDYVYERQKLDMMSSVYYSVRTEWGRAGRSFGSIEDWDRMRALAKRPDLSPEDQSLVESFIQSRTGKPLYQLKMEAKLGAQLNSPAKVAKFLRDAQKRSFGGMLLEYFINALISGPATHATYFLSNQMGKYMDATVDTMLASAIGHTRAALGRQGEHVYAGEAWEKLKAVAPVIGTATPKAIQGAIEALKTGQPTLLPGQEAIPLNPFFGDTAIHIAQNMQNDHVKWREAVGDLWSAMRGIKDGIVSGAQLMATGVPGAPFIGLQYSPGGQIPDLAIRGVRLLPGLVPGGTMARLPGRMVSAIHSFDTGSIYTAEIAARAYRDATNARDAAGNPLTGNAFDSRVAAKRQSPDQSWMEDAHKAAYAGALMAPPGKFVQNLSRLINTEFDLPFLRQTRPFKFIDPFVHIGANVINKSIVERTPVGLLSESLRNDLMGRNGNVAQDYAQARMLAGTALSLLFGSLAMEGYLTGSGPKDPHEAATRRGYEPPHSIRIGDMWYQVNRLGPLGMLAGISADMYAVAHEASDGDMLKAAAHLQHAFTQNVADESWIHGVASLIQSIEDPDRYGESYLKGFVSSFVPFSVGMYQIARASDPYARQARTVMDAIIQKVPGKSQELPPKINTLTGEPLPNPDALLHSGLTAIYMQKVNNDPVVRMLMDAGFFPAAPEKKIRNVELTPQEYEYFARIAGRTLKSMLDPLAASPGFRSAPAGVQHDYIKKMHDAALETARGATFGQYPHILNDAALDRRDQANGAKPPGRH